MTTGTGTAMATATRMTTGTATTTTTGTAMRTGTATPTPMNTALSASVPPSCSASPHGLVPSPSAVVVLVGAAALGRAWFGLLLVLAYGAGLALTLAAAGFAAVRLGERATRLLADRSRRKWRLLTTAQRALPRHGLHRSRHRMRIGSQGAATALA